MPGSAWSPKDGGEQGSVSAPVCTCTKANALTALAQGMPGVLVGAFVTQGPAGDGYLMRDLGFFQVKWEALLRTTACV